MTSNPAAQGRRVNIRPITHEETWPLRHLVLRTGRPISTCRWDGDELPTTHHYGLFEDEVLVMIASIYDRGHDCAPSPDSWQLRGMACRPDRQGQGLGARLLTDVIGTCKTKLGARLMWCNARIRAVSLYERHGFRTWGEQFEIAGIGPHYVMMREL